MLDAPINAEGRIVPTQYLLIGGTIKLVAFIEEIRALGAHDKAMRKATRHPELAPVLIVQIDRHMLAESGTTGAHPTATSRTAPRSTVTSFPWALGF